MLITVSVLALVGCSSTHHSRGGKATSETVKVAYHIQAGKEHEFQLLLARAWEVYRGEHLVFAQPHVIVRDSEDGNKTRFVEIFTWVKSPDHAPQNIQVVWEQEQSFCEARNGQSGIEISEVKLVTGK